MILKGIGGFYYVQTSEGVYECPARGKFRKEKITPYAGDQVVIETQPDMKGVVIDIQERKNYLVRPPIANIDNLFIVTSMVNPVPNTLIIDKTIAAAEIKHIDPVLVITKTDLSQDDGLQQELKEIYDKAGVPCFLVSAISSHGMQGIRELLKDKLSAFTGNSGVGKSTLLNVLFPNLELKTGEISEKLGRGRHTTREVELYAIDGGGYVADTPGFSTFDIQRYEITDKDNLIFGFRDFMPLYGQCKFSSCSHTGEKGCAISQAVTKGTISDSRYKSYLAMYDEIKDNKPWMTNKNA